jgi:hypothetical protein
LGLCFLCRPRTSRKRTVWILTDVVEDSEERLLVQDQVIDVGSKDLQLLNEVFPLLRAERYGTRREEDV